MYPGLTVPSIQYPRRSEAQQRERELARQAREIAAAQELQRRQVAAFVLGTREG